MSPPGAPSPDTQQEAPRPLRSTSHPTPAPSAHQPEKGGDAGDPRLPEQRWGLSVLQPGPEAPRAHLEENG